jgi:hypothetical protein
VSSACCFSFASSCFSSISKSELCHYSTGHSREQLPSDSPSVFCLLFPFPSLLSLLLLLRVTQSFVPSIRFGIGRVDIQSIGCSDSPRDFRLLSLFLFTMRSGSCSSSAMISIFGGAALQKTALAFRSTRKQQGNCGLILATVHLYRIQKLHVFVFCPFTSSRSINVGKALCHFLRHYLFVRPVTSVAIAAQSFSQRDSIVDVFICCPATRTSIRPGLVNVWIQGIVPSVPALAFHSTRN